MSPLHSNFKHLIRILLFFLSVPNGYAAHPDGYAVASAHPLATNAGLEMLAAGGNAFDAAIAVSAVLAVVAPYHSGLGGGGFWLLHQEALHQDTFIDGRETAPLASTKTMFLDKEGKPIPLLSLNGGLAAAIPGEPAALVLIAEQFGRLPLTQTLAPAIRLAESGFPVDFQLNRFLTMGDRIEQIKKHQGSVKVFLHDGKPYQTGEQLIQHDLARTLRLLAEKGHDGFYKGEIAERLVKAVNQAGGKWSMKDLALYKVKIRKPLHGTFHDMHIVTAPPPSEGGVNFLLMLQILSSYPLDTWSKVQWVHYVVESMRLSFWQVSQLLGDPDFVQIPIKSILSEKNKAYLQSFIKKDRATKSATLAQKTPPEASSDNTTHFSIIDKEGNRVSATLTINYIFGSSVVADGTGVLLNDEMDDFAIKPGTMNVYGLVGGQSNQIEPGKRPSSSMTPTFLETPGRVAILGTPGGSRIPTMVLLAALAFHDSFGAISMVSLMRFHHQYLPDQLQFEPDTFSKELQKELEHMGYQLAPLPEYFGDMQAITWDQKNHLLTAASDPRHIGLGAVVGQPLSYGLMYNKNTCAEPCVQ